MIQGIKDNDRKNPFPGLRPYHRDESRFFFGRDNESREILRKLIENRFVAVTGPSGSGKSSLIQCGVLDGIRRLSLEDHSEWDIISFKPGNDPVSNLAKALYEFGSSRATGYKSAEVIEDILFQSQGNPEELLKKIRGGNHGNLLIFADQFEDLFRKWDAGGNTRTEEGRRVVIEFLSDIVTKAGTNAYVIIAMRSDLISDCTHFTRLTRLINNSNYLVPEMTRENYTEVIECPLKEAGVSIEPDLVETILGDLAEISENLPVLQHTLMRTYAKWIELEQSVRPLGLSEYKSAGTLKNAMSRHADELYNSLTPEGKVICERLFRNITGKGPDGRGIRCPSKISDLVQIINCSEDELIKVINTFRNSEGTFILPHRDVSLDSDSCIDLVHESLIRLWPRLSAWVEEEEASIRIYLNLSELSSMFQQGRTGLMKNPDLQIAIDWRESNNPTLTWARKFDPAFERAMVYLRTSEKTFIAEEEQRSNRQKARLRRIRIFSRILGATALIAGIFTIIAFLQKSIAENSRLIAEAESKEAQQQRVMAEKFAVTFQRQSEESDSIASVARINEMAALQVKEISEKMRREAERIAEEARKEQTAAVALKAETQRLRMISVAKSMSLRSLQMPGKRDLQSLLAYQAFLFNKRNSGHYNDADIYAGLYNLARQYGNESYRTFTGLDTEVRSLAFVPGKSEFVTSCNDGRIVKWDLSRNEQNVQVVYSGSEIFDVIAVSNNADWLACGGAGPAIRMIPVSGTDQGYELKGHSGKIKSLVFSYDGNYLYSAALDGKVLKWDLAARTSVDVSTGVMAVTSIELSADNNFLAGLSPDGEVLVWNPENRTDRITIGAEGKTITSLRFKPSENILGVGYSDGMVELWDINGRERISTIAAHSAAITNLRFNGKIHQMATTDIEGLLKLWDTEDYTNTPVSFSDNEDLIVAIDFSPDGQVILTGTGGGIGNLVARPTLAESLVTGVCADVARNFTQDEWQAYVGRDIEYEKTCAEADYQIRINRVRN